MIEVVQIDSRHLAGNVIGDPSRRDLLVYLPPSYARSTRRYPVAYLLHGFGRRAAGWNEGPWVQGGILRPPIDDVLDDAIRRRGAEEMIVVMPDGWSRWGCSQWVDSPVNGNFEQYVAREIVPYVDRSLPDPARPREPRGLRDLVGRSRRVASRVAQSRRLRRHGAPVRRFLLRLHAQALAVQVLQPDLPAGTERPRQRRLELLVLLRDRLLLYAQRREAAVLRRSAR